MRVKRGMLTKQRDCGEQREREENESGETSKGFFRPGYRDNRHLHAISFLHHIKKGTGEGGRGVTEGGSYRSYTHTHCMR